VGLARAGRALDGQDRAVERAGEPDRGPDGGLPVADTQRAPEEARRVAAEERAGGVEEAVGGGAVREDVLGDAEEGGLEVGRADVDVVEDGRRVLVRPFLGLLDVDRPGDAVDRVHLAEALGVAGEQELVAGLQIRVLRGEGVAIDRRLLLVRGREDAPEGLEARERVTLVQELLVGQVREAEALPPHHAVLAAVVQRARVRAREVAREVRRGEGHARGRRAHRRDGRMDVCQRRSQLAAARRRQWRPWDGAARARGFRAARRLLGARHGLPQSQGLDQVCRIGHGDD
jgi:hypothetical protein